MEIHEHTQGAVNVLQPRGALVQDDAAAFRSRLLESVRESMGRLVVDASSVPYADSNGLEALLDATDELGSVGRSLKLCGVNESLREALDLTEICGRFDIYEDTTTAVRSFL